MAAQSCVLIADDDEAYPSGLLRVFGDDAIETSRVCGVEELLAVLDKQPGSSLELVLEPFLPGTNWYTLLRRCTQLCLPERITVVTAFPSRALTDFAEEAGIRRVFGKNTPPDVVRAAIQQGQVSRLRVGGPGQLSLATVEWEHLNRVLLDTEGNITLTARLLRIPRQTVYRKLRKHPVLLEDETIPISRACRTRDLGSRDLDLIAAGPRPLPLAAEPRRASGPAR